MRNPQLTTPLARSMRMLLPLGLALTVLTGCMVGPNYVRPKTPLGARFTAAAAGPYSSRNVEVAFWKQFQDPTLDHLVSTSLRANYSLRIALGRLMQSRALRDEARFQLVPTVTAAGGYTKQRVAAASNPFGTAYSTSAYDAGFDAVWELDFFGGVRRGIEARNAALERRIANLHDAQVSVIAAVARNYFELRGEQSELSVARANVRIERQALELTRAQLNAGSCTELDVARAQAQLSTTLASISPLQAAVSRSMHRLGVLLGRQPDALDALLRKARPLPHLPRIVPVGGPAQMLRRRPDIRAAEMNLAQSTDLVGVAIADLFPKVTFTGNIGYSAVSLSGLGTSGARTYSIGPGISWAAFDLGRVHEEIASARAGEVVAFDEYRRTVLHALEQTEDALVTHARDLAQQRNAADAARASALAAHLATVRYRGGMVGFLAVLDAERTQLQAEDALAADRMATATSLVAVYQALGGGWEVAPLPKNDLAALRR